jgi:hypothetical protein
MVCVCDHLDAAAFSATLLPDRFDGTPLSSFTGGRAMGDEYCRKCSSRLTTCPTCSGKGTTYQGGLFGSERPCPNCRGTGKLCPRHGYDWG